MNMKKSALLVFLLLVVLGAAPRKITWVAIGDSITYLNDHQEQTGNRVTKGYMTLIADRHPRVSYINKGYNGWTAINIADKIETLDLSRADVYTVFLGTNDWWQGKMLGSIKNYKENTGSGTVYGAFRIITDKLKSLNTRAKIILITPMQRGDFVYINNPKNNAYGSYKLKKDQSLEQFADAVIEIGKSGGFAVVDLYHQSGMNLENMVRYKRIRSPGMDAYTNFKYPDYTSVPFNPEKDDYPYPQDAIHMTYDGLHPSDEGYRIIADMLEAKWKKLR
jgi:lysophospholipase L1-like esterase